jgi:hypothetical protein
VLAWGAEPEQQKAIDPSAFASYHGFTWAEFL